MPLIGRERELEQLRQAIAQGGHVLISGRAGIGKSALMRTLAEQLPQAVVVPTGTPKLVLLAALEQAHQRVGLRVPEGLLPATVKLRPGPHRVRASLSGYYPAPETRVQVGASEPAELTLHLVASH